MPPEESESNLRAELETLKTMLAELLELARRVKAHPMARAWLGLPKERP